MKKALVKELSEAKLNLEIPKFFSELKALAKPVLYLKGPTTTAEFREGVDNIIKQVPGAPAHVTPAGGVPMPKP